MAAAEEAIHIEIPELLAAVTQNDSELMAGLNGSNATRLGPPPQITDDFIQRTKVIVSLGYAIMLTVGVLGNSWVIATVMRIFKHQVFASVPRSAYSSKGSFYRLLARRSISSAPEQQNHIFFFIVALCMADLMLLLTTPLTIADLLLETWVFGELMCVLYWLVEGVNKILSISILTLLSLDRFLALSFPRKTFQFRSPKGACLQLSVCALMSLLLIVPMLVFTRVRVFTTRLPDNVTLTIAKCSNEAPGNQYSTLFFAYMFCYGFAIPAALISVFYGRVICILHHTVNQGRSILTSSIPVQGITRSILSVVGFYFLCWSPYWGFVTLMALEPAVIQRNVTLKQFFILSYSIHGLVYLNSSANWVFYALMNRELRRVSARRKSSAAASKLFDTQSAAEKGTRMEMGEMEPPRAGQSLRRASTPATARDSITAATVLRDSLTANERNTNEQITNASGTALIKELSLVSTHLN